MSERKGELTTIYGPMFSGKTGELIDRIESLGAVLKNSVMIKPDIDTRYDPIQIVTHSGKKIDAFPVNVKTPQGILDVVLRVEYGKKKLDIVGIDEVQFFEPGGVIWVIEHLLEDGKAVLVAGLPTDFRDEPFGATPILIAKADHPIAKTAYCKYLVAPEIYCSRSATKTQRIIDGKPAEYSEPVIVVGAAELYEARCREHHEVPGRPINKSNDS
jgi:thymidine kinase